MAEIVWWPRGLGAVRCGVGCGGRFTQNATRTPPGVGARAKPGFDGREGWGRRKMGATIGRARQRACGACVRLVVEKEGERW